jgi:hypothetical protein
MGVMFTDVVVINHGRRSKTLAHPIVFIDRPTVAPREITRTMIVCGDCAGEYDNPRKTLLTKEGRCAGCGGNSYVLAAIILRKRRLDMRTEKRTPDQQQIASRLSSRYGIEPDRVFFPDPTEPTKPWLGADELTHIARQSERFQEIATTFDTFIIGLNQVVHRARVIDKEGRSFERVGIATLGEKLRGVEADEHQLAGSRAVVAALSTAGFNPLRMTQPSRAEIATPNPSSIAYADNPDVRWGQTRQIHALAQKLGLILPAEAPGGKRDMTKYKAFLLEHYGVESSAGMDESGRASLINALQLMEREYDEL